MQVSAALIVKNEEHTLPRCLASIRDHVDEIVIVDTGSTDRTKEVARQFTDRIYDLPWRRDFAAARQHAFDRARGDWVFWVDADDVVMNAARIRPALEAAPPDVRAIYWKYVAGRDEYGNSTCEFWRERCVRHDGFFRWRGRVHEVLTPAGPCATARNEEVFVLHLREPRPDRNPLRNIDILNEEYRRGRSRPQPRLLLCLAAEYADLGQTDTAIEYLQKYLQLSNWDEERYFAQLRLAELYRARLRFHEAADAALAALKVNPFWPNAYFSLAESYYYLKDWARVVHWADVGRQLPAPDTVCIVNPRTYLYAWIIHYTNALYHVGRVAEALEWTEKGLAQCPGETWHIMNWHFFAEALRAREPAEPAAANGHLPTIFWQGPLFDPSGYADEGRQFVLGLHSVGARVRAVPYFRWNPDRAELLPADVVALRELARTPVSRPGEQVVSVLHMTADHFHRIPGAVLHIGRTMCETDRIPESWVEPCNWMDEVWVPSQFNVETFAASGVRREKLVAMPEGVDIGLFHPETPPLAVPGRRGFNFLSVFEWSRRKGWDVLLRAFVEEFGPAADVALIFKAGIVGGRRVEQFREEALAALRGWGLPRSLPANVVFYQVNLAAAQMPALYRAADAFVLASRGEGWGRPLMEAMACGLPAIATRWSGPLEFMNDQNSWLIGCQLTDVPEPAWREAPIYRGHRWAEPSVAELRRALREVFENRTEARRRAESGLEHIRRHFSREAVAQRVCAHLATRVGQAEAGLSLPYEGCTSARAQNV